MDMHAQAQVKTNKKTQIVKYNQIIQQDASKIAKNSKYDFINTVRI